MDKADPPAEWLEAIACGEADLAAGRIRIIDVDDFCREIHGEADELERQIAAQSVSPA